MQKTIEYKKKLRIIKKNDYVLLLWNNLRIKKQKKKIEKFTDQSAIENIYNSKFDQPINLEKPIRFSEKIQWLKLNFRKNELSNYADKYAVRQIIENKGYGYILNGFIGVWDNVENIDFKTLPNQFVLKATHGSGMNLIVKDKSKVNWFIWKKIMKSWLKQNIYIEGREWPYKNIKPQILCEELIDTGGEDLRDYKFFCFNGEPKYIQVDGERYKCHQRVFYDSNWELQQFQIGGYQTEFRALRPKMLNEMIEIASDLSEPFPFARIDFYNVDEKIYFGEVTFSPGSGWEIIEPKSQDIKMGKMLKLPIS